MKRKLFSLVLAICLLVCVGGLVACGSTPKVPSKPSDSSGPQDYVEGDSKIITTFNYDISEQTEAFYIGSNAIAKVEVNGNEIPANDYIVRKNHLLMPDGWFGTLGQGTHTCEVTYKTKSLTYTFTIADEKPLVYTIPNIDRSYHPSDDVAIPMVDFKYPAQEKQVEYEILNAENQEVDFTQEDGVIKLADPEVGKYTYKIEITRKGQTETEEYSFNVVSRDYYDGIIDTTNGDINRDMWHVMSASNSFGHANYTDKNGETRSALFFDRQSTADDHTRAIGINRERMVELLRLGYTKLGFWYCMDFEEIDYTNLYSVHLYTDGSKILSSEFAISNTWQYKEINITSLINVDRLSKDDSSKFVFGFITRHYFDVKPSPYNGPVTLYLSEVVATSRNGDASAYYGTYTNGNSSLVLSENNVKIDGQDYTYNFNNNYLSVDKGNHEYEAYVVSNGLVVNCNTKAIYQNTEYKQVVFANTPIDLKSIIKPLFDDGMGVECFVVENEINDNLADETFNFNASNTYSLKVNIGQSTCLMPIEVVVPTSTGNLAHNLVDAGYATGYLTKAENGGEQNSLFNWNIATGERVLYFCAGTSTLNAMIFDNDFVKDCFDKGFNTIKGSFNLTMKSDNPSIWGQVGPAIYHSSSNTFTKLSAWGTSPYFNTWIKQGGTINYSWTITASEIAQINFDAGDKLAFYGLSTNVASRVEMIFSSFEFADITSEIDELYKDLDYTSNFVDLDVNGDIAVLSNYHVAGAGCAGCGMPKNSLSSNIGSYANSISILRTNWCTEFAYFDKTLISYALENGYTKVKIVWNYDTSNGRQQTRPLMSSCATLDGSKVADYSRVGEDTVDANGLTVSIFDISTHNAENYLRISLDYNIPMMLIMYEISFTK